MLLGNALRNGEAQASAWSKACVVCPVEALKNPGQVTWGNANAGISHGDGHRSSVQASHNFYLARGRRIFEGVIQQDQKQLLDVVGIAPDERPFQQFQITALQCGFAIRRMSLAAEVGDHVSHQDRFVGRRDMGIRAG